MKKILVPIDFSVNSKRGARFAIHWSTQQKLELVFIHILHILRPTIWTDAYFAKYAEREEKICRAKFEKFVAGIYRKPSVKPGKYSLLIVRGISADISILNYCRGRRDIDYVCICTRGAGKFKKIFGSNTAT